MNIKNLFNKLKEKIIINRYIHCGIIWGDICSYDYMFGDTECAKPWKRKLDKWERKYITLGYIPITADQWVDIGGYGDNLGKYICKRDKLFYQGIDKKKILRYTVQTLGNERDKEMTMMATIINFNRFAKPYHNDTVSGLSLSEETGF